MVDFFKPGLQASIYVYIKNRAHISMGRDSLGYIVRHSIKVYQAYTSTFMVKACV